jgi:transitional endoplasmic reticulum ATPase
MKTGKITPIRTGDLLAAAKKQRPSTREWFATAKNYALYANQGGHYDEILQYMNIRR